ncbi:hypothetical protein CEQ90_07055 [Lewinellaceae bacterium SD302]|nr:hypothetical protein CEQ90_07055 [Lewinellaceae bacterium SD302]
MRLPPTIMKDRSWRVHLTLLDFALLLVGLVFSPPLLSIGIIGICVVGILDIPKGINPRWRRRVRAGLQDPFSWAVLALYLILLLGVWQTEDWGYYVERLRIKAALLWVPIGWWGIPKLRAVERQGVILFFCVMMLIVGIGVTLNYLLDYEAINQAIREGRAVPVPRNHIRFSLLVSLATISGLELARVNAFGRIVPWLIIAACLFLFQHLLAVRSGLVCAYLGVGTMLLVYVLKSKNWRVGVAALLLLLAVPMVAYLTVPSLRAKVAYARYELWRQENKLESLEYSDAGRLTSIRFGMKLFRENPIMGVGAGNLRMRMDALYAEQLPAAEAKRPHNQFVSVLAGGGLLSFVPFVLALLWLLFGKCRWRDPAFAAVWVIMISSCLVENTLENSAGLGIFCFFLFFFRPDEIADKHCVAGGN